MFHLQIFHLLFASTYTRVRLDVNFESTFLTFYSGITKLIATLSLEKISKNFTSKEVQCQIMLRQRKNVEIV